MIYMFKKNEDTRRLAKETIIAFIICTILFVVLKLIFQRPRPFDAFSQLIPLVDKPSDYSFPSGHTATAFMGAEFLYQEYKDISPWIGYSGYLIAATTGYLRIYNNRHYLNDVVAGACIGIISTKFAYWLYPKVFTKSKCHHSNFHTISTPFYADGKVGVNVCMSF